MQKLLFFTSMIVALNACVQEPQVVKLWNEGPPNNNNLPGDEYVNQADGWISNISSAELYIYKAKNNKDGKAVVICPGGGYVGLAIAYEGHEFAEWLNELGITAIVLKYREPNMCTSVPEEDAREAIRYVRENAEDLGVDKEKIGIAGFSAGGHLASTVSTHFSESNMDTHPNFSILFYPVISMDESITHMGSREHLLGKNPTEDKVNEYSNEKRVTKNTPPTILLLSDDDLTVAPINSIKYYNALKNNDVGATMYIFPTGWHGWGFKKDFLYHNEMKSLLKKWLENL